MREQKGGDSHFIKATRNALVQSAHLPPTQKLNYFIIRAGPPQIQNRARQGSMPNAALHTYSTNADENIACAAAAAAGGGGGMVMHTILAGYTQANMAPSTEGGGIKGRVRPAVGINTDVDGLERLRTIITQTKAQSDNRGRRSSMPSRLFAAEEDADGAPQPEWSPYGKPLAATYA